MMMFRYSDKLMFTRSAGMGGDALVAVMDFDLIPAFTDPYRRSRICPRYRVTIAFPGHVRIASDLPQFFIDVGVWQPTINRLQPEFFFGPSLIDTFVRGSMNALIANSPDPLPELAVEVAQVAGLATLQTAQEVSTYIFHAGLDLSFRLRAIWLAESRAETPITREI